MIETIAFLLLLIFLFAIFLINKEAVFFIVLANIIFFITELIIQNSIYYFSYYTSSPLSYGLLTGIFTHYNFIHIFLNMIVLLLVGFPLESRIGTRRFLLIYLITGIISEIIFSLVNYGQNIILLGASGSIFGVMGALLRLYPNDEIPMFLGFIFLPKIKVKYAVFFAALIEFIAIFLSYENNVAHLVHISALIVVMLIAPLFIGLKIKSIENLPGAAENKKLLEEIKKEKIWELKYILLEEYLKKNCKEYEIKRNYIICNGKKYRL
ncbi:MAG: rhomboid family intramembrane serine protease [Thermoplasmata archaeon]